MKARRNLLPLGLSLTLLAAVASALSSPVLAAIACGAGSAALLGSVTNWMEV
jgi:hypothetical protein